MSDIKIVVTLIATVHPGVNTPAPTSRVFSANRSIADMLNWAENMGVKAPTINDLIFSEYTGESM